MNKFGTVKSKILQKLTEAYANGKKDEIRDIIKLMKENKYFLNMYLTYEEIENKNIEDKEHAKLFVEEITPLLKKHTNDISKFVKKVDKQIGDVTVVENEVYSYLDILSEDDTLRNVDKKIVAKKKLVEHLTKKKDDSEVKSVPIIENETLLRTILANNFNVLYGSTLTEEEKSELRNILSTTDEELQTNFVSLKEEMLTKMNSMITEEKNADLLQKLNTALTEAEHMTVTKYNYYRLQQLKSGL